MKQNNTVIKTLFTRRRVLVGVIVAGFAIALIAALSGGRHSGPKQADAAPPLTFLPSEVVQPKVGPVGRGIELAGVLQAADSVTVRARVSGRLLSLPVQEGDRVRQGQQLGELDLTDARAKVLERQAAMTAALADEANAQSKHEANVALTQKGFLSPVALKGSEAALQAARASRQSAQAQLETAKLRLSEAELTAPIAGVIAKRQAVVGEMLNPDQPILQVLNLGLMELSASVAAADAGLLAVGQSVKVTVDEAAGLHANGRIHRVGPASDAAARAMPVVVRFQNPGPLLPGQYGRALLTLADERPRITVPIHAVGLQGADRIVWELTEGQLRRRVVFVDGQTADGLRLIVRGDLTDKSQILARQFDNLREGQKASVGAPPLVPPVPSGSRPPAQGS